MILNEKNPVYFWHRKIDFESQILAVFDKSPLYLLIERGLTIQNLIVSPKPGSFFQSEKFVCLRGFPIFLATVTSTSELVLQGR